MTVAVTGASGHLGVNLVTALAAAGRPVRALSRRTQAAAAAGVEWTVADVLDPESLRAALSGCETVYHLAGEISIAGDPGRRMWRTNVEGTRNVLEAALACGVRRFVHCSTVEAYDVGRSGGALDEDGPPATRPRLPAYGRSKAAAEEEVRAALARGLDAVIVSPTAVIGPADPGPSRMGKVFLDLRRRRIPALVSGGFDWVDVRDVATALVAAEARGRRGERYLVPGHWLTVRELAEVAASVTGVPAPRLTTPLLLARLAAPLVPLVVRERTRRRLTADALYTLRFSPRVDGAKAARELGHRPRPVEQTVRDLYAWFDDAARA